MESTIFLSTVLSIYKDGTEAPYVDATFYVTTVAPTVDPTSEPTTSVPTSDSKSEPPYYICVRIKCCCSNGVNNFLPNCLCNL